jgi:hypothetical protein
MKCRSDEGMAASYIKSTLSKQFEGRFLSPNIMWYLFAHTTYSVLECKVPTAFAVNLTYQAFARKGGKIKDKEDTESTAINFQRPFLLLQHHHHHPANTYIVDDQRVVSKNGRVNRHNK